MTGSVFLSLRMRLFRSSVSSRWRLRAPSIEAIEERLIKSPPFVYEGEAPVQVTRLKEESPFETYYFRDLDGNDVDLSEKGWTN